MNHKTHLIGRNFWIILVLLAALLLAACGDDDDNETKPTPTDIPTATATDAPTAEPTDVPTKVPTTAPTKVPTAAPTTDEEPTSEAAQIVHPAGTGACATRQVTMGGSFNVCIAAPCDKPLDSGAVSYENKTEVGSCTEEGLIGVCSSSAFDVYYYDGELDMLQIGCGFMAGEWKPAGS